MATEDVGKAVLQALDGGILEVADLSGEQAGTHFRQLATLLDFGSADVNLLTELVNRIVHSADPAMALKNLLRFAEATPEPDVVRQALKRGRETSQVLVTLMAGSQFLSDVLIRQPELFTWLLSHETLHGARSPDYYREGVAAAVAGLQERPEQRAAIIRWRHKEYLRIGVRDLLLVADAEEVSRDISDLAEAIIDRASIICYDELATRFGAPMPDPSSWEENVVTPMGNVTPAGGLALSTGMCVLGMGKLGGRELNFSSDIDLVFVYESEGETMGRMDAGRRVAVISNHDYFARMGEKLVKFLGERGPEGHLFRVDMRLRPEGVDGPLARSLESFIHYLNTQGRDWERIAYLKARVVSGPVRLAEKLYRVMAQFVFAGLQARRIVTEVQELKLRIDREVMQSELYRREVKRGYGGIREIEFVISALQIIHGYTHHALRVRNTFLAIQRLLETHIITRDTAEFYQHAYSFLRMVEHRLQMAQEAQTHTLPPAGHEFEAMARRCGFRDGAEFTEEYQRITEAVHQRFTQFFEHDTEAIEQAARDVMIIMDRNASEAEATAALQRRGLPGTGNVRLVHALAFGTRDVFVTAEGQRSFEQMLPALLRMTAAAPQPDRVLAQFHSFALAIKGITYYYEVIAQHPEILKLLVTLFGTSDSLSAQLIAYPEFFDSLISTRVLDAHDPDGTARRQRMLTALAVKSHARRLSLLRRVVHFERLVLALQYLLELRPLEDCLADLSDVADTAIEIAMQLAVERLWERAEERRPADSEVQNLMPQLADFFAVLALGKYGGRELNFYGDLDVVYVYDQSAAVPPPFQQRYSTAQEFADSLADALVSVLAEQRQGGRAFELDARLRPYGRSAPLTAEKQAYGQYLASADTWELQAFHRARTAWGRAYILEELQQAANRTARNRTPDSLTADVCAMRARLEEATPARTDTLEVKRTAGALVDVEFLLQYCVLAGVLPWSPVTANYYSALKAGLGAAADPQLAPTLLAAYRVLRAVENTIRLVTGGSESSLPLDSPVALSVARSLGFGSAELMAANIAEVKEMVRRTCRQLLPCLP